MPVLAQQVARLVCKRQQQRQERKLTRQKLIQASVPNRSRSAPNRSRSAMLHDQPVSRLRTHGAGAGEAANGSHESEQLKVQSLAF